VFPVVSFLLAFPPISYMHFSSPPFVLHALPFNGLHGIISQKIENPSMIECLKYEQLNVEDRKGIVI
jgi:hypothetical protein